ncbi:nucleotidyltransferase domain-containing protein [Clostridium formicaceticum]|uniref:Nucleotidyltransferase n=1 Tax=Clostridium formicaceticum TaxID=1497 RepID=A0AAC9WIC4_9CLOT|nr:nucleotidyltransferase family protein [Clostridium formicaceticum]AOY77992.1 hypothetical protein BJL90_20260 [Clostridium formicaceticum]ARE88620.1 hypothetical protein CLFO_30260 [Clostridium formicaceticum]
MTIIQLERGYLIHLLSSVLHDAQPQNPPENLDWEKLYKLSTWHSVSNMVCYCLSKLSSKPPQDIMVKFYNDYKKGIAKEATQHIIVEQVLKIFEENHIACMPLKGYLIKYLYPQPDMRLMVDVDILFKNEQKKQVKKLMLGLGFTLESEGGNHDVYYKKPFMNIEMHRRLIAENSPYSDYLNKVWDRAILKTGYKCIYQLSHEDFFVYIMIHLTKHYANGGTGIRSIMDIWVYNKHYRDKMDWEYIQAELEKIQLWKFTKNICRLSEIWFESRESNELYDEMTAYIFSSGVCGIKKHSIVSSMNADKKRSIGTAKQIYRLKLFFPGLNRMKISYPFLGKLPFLLPVCWVLRGVKCLLFKPKHTFQMINDVDSISEADMAKIQNLHEKAGLLK